MLLTDQKSSCIPILFEPRGLSRFSLQHSGKTSNWLSSVDQFRQPQLNITEEKGTVQREETETLRTNHARKFVHIL